MSLEFPKRTLRFALALCRAQSGSAKSALAVSNFSRAKIGDSNLRRFSQYVQGFIIRNEPGCNCPKPFILSPGAPAAFQLAVRAGIRACCGPVGIFVPILQLPGSNAREARARDATGNGSRSFEESAGFAAAAAVMLFG